MSSSNTYSVYYEDDRRDFDTFKDKSSLLEKDVGQVSKHQDRSLQGTHKESAKKSGGGRVEGFEMDGNLSYSSTDLTSSYEDMTNIQAPSSDMSYALASKATRRRRRGRFLKVLCGLFCFAVGVAIVASIVVLYLGLVRVNYGVK